MIIKAEVDKAIGNVMHDLLALSFESLPVEGSLTRGLCAGIHNTTLSSTVVCLTLSPTLATSNQHVDRLGSVNESGSTSANNGRLSIVVPLRRRLLIVLAFLPINVLLHLRLVLLGRSMGLEIDLDEVVSLAEHVLVLKE